MSRVLVVGCGPSVRGEVVIDDSLYDFTVGVNDCERWRKVDHLVVLDCPAAFRQPAVRLQTILGFRGVAFWSGTGRDTWVKAGWPENGRGVTSFRFFTSYNPTKFELSLGRAELPCFGTSPFTACVLAYQLGAKRIDLIGVDITKDHSLWGQREQIRSQFARLRIALLKKGCQLVNLSPFSILHDILPEPTDEVEPMDAWSPAWCEQKAATYLDRWSGQALVDGATATRLVEGLLRRLESRTLTGRERTGADS